MLLQYNCSITVPSKEGVPSKQGIIGDNPDKTIKSGITGDESLANKHCL